MHRIALYEAKNKLTGIVRQAENGEIIELTRHGKPVAVLIGSEGYKTLKKGMKSFSGLLDAFNSEWPAGSDETGQEPEDPFRDIRSRDTGRTVEL